MSVVDDEKRLNVALGAKQATVSAGPVGPADQIADYERHSGAGS
jgi:hypothetical protein